MLFQRFWHDFCNLIFKIKHKLHIPLRWATCALNKKFWVRIWFSLSFISHSVHYHSVIQYSAAWFTIIVKLQINRNKMLLHPVLKRFSSVCISDISLNSIFKYFCLNLSSGHQHKSITVVTEYSIKLPFMYFSIINFFHGA
jgi:hypothetical protein